MLNIAQIGVGYWGPNLLRNLVAIKRCRVKCVVDLVGERRDYVKSLYPAIQVSDDVNQIFQDAAREHGRKDHPHHQRDARSVDDSEGFLFRRREVTEAENGSYAADAHASETKRNVRGSQGELEDGGWRMEDRGWRMEDGRWKMEDGRWKMSHPVL